jgi:hypothetical protein
MKVLLLRADSLRHQALASILQSSGFLTAEIVESKSLSSIKVPSSLITEHYKARLQSEEDFFKCYSNFNLGIPSLKIENGALNSLAVMEFVNHQTFDIAITFGVSILKNELIQILRNNILGIHLGLSPYYRGSGTNFFPFVNSELSAVGYTLMHLNLGIDKGPIVHQGRAPIVLGDSIHTIGNRNITLMFADILRILREDLNLKDSCHQISGNGKLYKRKDFTEESLKLALANLAEGLILKHLAEEINNHEKFPLVQYEFQKS